MQKIYSVNDQITNQPYPDKEGRNNNIFRRYEDERWTLEETLGINFATEAYDFHFVDVLVRNIQHDYRTDSGSEIRTSRA